MELDRISLLKPHWGFSWLIGFQTVVQHDVCSFCSWQNFTYQQLLLGIKEQAGW